MLFKEPVTAIYSTSFDRNILTVKPLAEAKKVDVLLYEWHNWQPMLRKVRRTGRGKTQVICGHGDNLLPMIEFLDGTLPLDSLGSYEYDKIFRVEYGRDSTSVTMTRY
jgi:2,3-bisphosphoglycerate-dependent phosphoglycerate mutase